MALPRSFRNHNPCNIPLGITHWDYQATVQTDTKYVVFDTMIDGYRAAFRLLESYRNQFLRESRPFTIRSVIERWAPGYEKNTAAYIQLVVMMTNIPADRLLLLPEINGKDAVKIIAAMTVVEGGISQDQIPWDDLKQGYWKAFPQGWLPEE